MRKPQRRNSIVQYINWGGIYITQQNESDDQCKMNPTENRQQKQQQKVATKPKLKHAIVNYYVCSIYKQPNVLKIKS